MTLHLPTTPDEARAAGATGVYRAGGTDLPELRRRGLRAGDVVDLRDVTGLSGVRDFGDGWWLGARTPLREVAADPALAAAAPGLADALGGLATPQIRARASLGGSLLQEVRCSYFRSEEPRCWRKGETACAARDGVAPFHAVVGDHACHAVHPSTPAMALLAFDAVVDVDGDLRTIPELLGEPAIPRTHALRPGQLLRAALVPRPPAGEGSAWVRIAHRARAEWPLVEAVARVSLAADGALARVVFAVGGIAGQPLRWDALGAAAVGLRPDDPALDAVFAPIVADARHPGTRWRAPLVPVAIGDAVRAAAARCGR